MAQATDFTIANQSFPNFRTDLNTVLGAINSSNSGTSRPSSATTGTFWLDTSNSGSNLLVLKFFDGSDDITFATFNTSSNTVDVSDSSSDVVGDTTPQLGGNLDVNGNDIVSTSNADIDIAPNGTGDINLTAGADVNIPANIGLTFGDDGEKIEGDGTNLTISSSNAFTIDAANGVTLDGGGTACTLKAGGGTTYGQLANNSGNLIIKSGTTTAVTFNGAVSSFVAANVSQQALTSSSNAVAWDASAKPNAYHLTTENTTFAAPTNSVEGAFIALEINYDGSHTIAFNTVFEFAGSTAPTFTSTDGKTDILVFKYNGSVWQEVGRTLNLSES